jgi:ABC-2 type transport system permease protein
MLLALRELRGYGYLFRTFFRRDLSARYKASVLGIVWSLLNPLMMMVIYTLVFSRVLGIAQEDYPAWFITGFLPWFFFTTALSMGTQTLVGSSALITKVYFPRELLPLAMTAANLVNMLIAYAIFLPYAVWVRGISPAIILLIPISIAFFVFTAAITMLLSAAMVYFRDVEFLLGILLSAWFYAVPVLYNFNTHIHDATWRDWLERDPVVPFINAFRKVVFDKQAVSPRDMIVLYAIAIGTWLVSYAIFNRLKVRVAEEL